MGRYSFRAQRIHENVTGLLQAGRLERKPAWYDVVGATRTPELLTRTRPVLHNYDDLVVVEEEEQSSRRALAAAKKNRKRKASRMFRPVEIRYPEDRLRKTFFRDHPWELARPRIVTENDGVNGTERWENIRQRGRLMNGESVVQRQMYLMDKHGLSKAQAYDVARTEFYDERLKEDVARRVAREEALHYGAFFGPNRLEVGMRLEDAAFEDWKVAADRDVTQLEQTRMAGSASADATSSGSVADLPDLAEGVETAEGGPAAVR